MFILRSPVIGNRITDSFDRANANLTTPWTVTGTALSIVSNEAGLLTTGASQALYGLGLHSDSLFTDEQAVEFRRGTITYTSGTPALFGWIHANAGLTQGCAMSAVWTSATVATLGIYVPTAYNTYGTVKQQVTGITTALNDTFTLKNVGNVFTIYQNGVSKVSWTDSTNLVPLANRRVTFGAQASNSFSGNIGARAVDWAAYDLAA